MTVFVILIFFSPSFNHSIPLIVGISYFVTRNKKNGLGHILTCDLKLLGLFVYLFHGKHLIS